MENHNVRRLALLTELSRKSFAPAEFDSGYRPPPERRLHQLELGGANWRLRDRRLAHEPYAHGFPVESPSSTTDWRKPIAQSGLRRYAWRAHNEELRCQSAVVYHWGKTLPQFRQRHYSRQPWEVRLSLHAGPIRAQVHKRLAIPRGLHLVEDN